MERDLSINYDGEYFGDMLFCYNNYLTGQVISNRKEVKNDINYEGTPVRSIEHRYSNTKLFEHPKQALNVLETLDKTYVFDMFSAEIQADKLQHHKFTIYYSDDLRFLKFLYDPQIGIIGRMSINVDPRNQTKKYLFEPLHELLKGMSERIKVPFEKINPHITADFWSKKIREKFPNSYFTN